MQGFPSFFTKEVQTVARLGDGETLVIGGLSRRRREEGKGGIPFLRKIPLIGLLFSSAKDLKEDEEVVVLVTPRIVPMRRRAPSLPLPSLEREPIPLGGPPEELGVTGGEER